MGSCSSRADGAGWTWSWRRGTCCRSREASPHPSPGERSALSSRHDHDAHHLVGRLTGGPPTRASHASRPPRRGGLFVCVAGGAVPTKGTSMVAVSGITPSGRLTLGNYLGALRRFASGDGAEAGFWFVADLHAMTTRH